MSIAEQLDKLIGQEITDGYTRAILKRRGQEFRFGDLPMHGFFPSDVISINGTTIELSTDYYERATYDTGPDDTSLHEGEAHMQDLRKMGWEG